jgi:hypothetical protein
VGNLGRVDVAYAVHMVFAAYTHYVVYLDDIQRRVLKESERILLLTTVGYVVSDFSPCVLVVELPGTGPDCLVRRIVAMSRL